MSASPSLPDAEAGAPAPFRQASFGHGFLAFNGPLYGHWTGEKLLLGFRVESRHCNPMDVCHGGMLATLADMLVPCALPYQNPMAEHRFLPTVSLQVDYMGTAPRGSWVQGEAQILRTTRNLVFGQALVTADGKPALRVSGIFKIGPLMAVARPDDPFGLR